MRIERKQKNAKFQPDMLMAETSRSYIVYHSYGGEAVIQKYSCFLCHSFGLCYLCTDDSESKDEKNRNIDWHGDDGMGAVASVDPRRQ